MSTFIFFHSLVYWLLSYGDIESTNHNRERKRQRGLDPNTAEKAPVMRVIMNLLGDDWWKVRALLGHGLWCWLVLTQAWPLQASDTTVVWCLVGLNVSLAAVVYHNNRRRWDLWWPFGG